MKTYRLKTIKQWLTFIPISGAGFNLSLTYQYNSPGVNGIFYHESNHVVNCALNKAFLADKLIVTLKYNDVFNGQKQRMWTQMHDVRFVQGLDFDNSVIALGITCKFGKSSRKYELKENSKEELKRIK